MSIITYTAGIAIDAYFLSKQCNTDSRQLEVFLFTHMILVIALTVLSIVFLIIATSQESFHTSDYYSFFDIFDTDEFERLSEEIDEIF